MYICICQGVTDSQIQSAIDEGCHSVEKLSEALGVCNQCGECENDVCRLLKGKTTSSMQPPSIDIEPAVKIAS